MRGTSCLLLRFTVAGIGDVRCEMNAASGLSDCRALASGKKRTRIKKGKLRLGFAG